MGSAPGDSVLPVRISSRRGRCSRSRRGANACTRLRFGVPRRGRRKYGAAFDFPAENGVPPRFSAGAGAYLRLSVEYCVVLIFSAGVNGGVKAVSAGRCAGERGGAANRAWPARLCAALRPLCPPGVSRLCGAYAAGMSHGRGFRPGRAMLVFSNGSCAAPASLHLRTKQNRGFGFGISLPPGRQRHGGVRFFRRKRRAAAFFGRGTVLHPCSWVKGCAVSVLFG